MTKSERISMVVALLSAVIAVATATLPIKPDYPVVKPIGLYCIAMLVSSICALMIARGGRRWAAVILIWIAAGIAACCWFASDTIRFDAATDARGFQLRAASRAHDLRVLLPSPLDPSCRMLDEDPAAPTQAVQIDWDRATPMIEIQRFAAPQGLSVICDRPLDMQRVSVVVRNEPDAVNRLSVAAMSLYLGLIGFAGVALCICAGVFLKRV